MGPSVGQMVPAFITGGPLLVRKGVPVGPISPPTVRKYFLYLYLFLYLSIFSIRGVLYRITKSPDELRGPSVGFKKPIAIL